MSRVTPVIEATATSDEEALAAIHAAWGSVPQLARVIARSTPLTCAMLTFDAALNHGRFTGAFAEEIAIAVASEIRSPHCLAAHNAERALGLDEQTLSDARVGTAADPKIAAALPFAQSVVRERGHVDKCPARRCTCRRVDRRGHRRARRSRDARARLGRGARLRPH
jgi:hypothetical protein